jgi:uncharacterized OB-fold protein
MSKAGPIGEGLFTSLDAGTTHLIGSRCRDCGYHCFPVSPSCARCCGSSMQQVELGRRGTLWTWASQSFMPPSPPYCGPEDSADSFEPFLLGFIELPGECRVLSRLLYTGSREPEIGEEMELTLFAYRTGENGITLMAHAFRPVAKAGSDRLSR